MSVRLLRRILKEQEQNQKQEDDAITEDLTKDHDSESDSGGHVRNPFDLLNDNDDEHEYDQEDEFCATDDVTLAEKADDLKPTSKSTSPAVSSMKSKKKKKKKKNKATTFSGPVGPRKSELHLEAMSLDIGLSSCKDRSNKKISSNKEVHEIVAKQCKPSVLKVDPKFLNAENELLRIFGSSVIKRSFEIAKRRGYGYRKCILVSPSYRGPRWNRSLSVELLETKNGSHFFRYVHSASYIQAQREFEAARAINDISGVVYILDHHPYHVESLITLSEYFKYYGRDNVAADYVARCLYALDCAWQPMITPLQMNFRLQYSHDTNKPLFVILFSHMKNMYSQMCHRSALEVCKFLLSLDPADPKGALFWIDYLALRAEEYAWLEHFTEEYQSDSLLCNFPNFAYSLAIARYYLERDASSRDSKIEHEKKSSASLMKQALMLHPTVPKRLLEKVPLMEQSWVSITSNPFFGSKDTGLPSLDHLIRIYVERNYLIWRLPDVQKLVKDAAFGVIETLKNDANEANTWACLRKEAFPSEKNEYEHLRVSDFSDMATMVPANRRNLSILPRIIDVQRLRANSRRPLTVVDFL